MKESIFKLAQHIEQLSFLFQAGKSIQAQQYFSQLTLTEQDDLEGWMAHQLLQSPKNKQDLPEVVSLHIAAWQAYYQHQYIDAHAIFAQILMQQDWQNLVPTAALGLAKVYTRTGHWHAARAWAIYYLSLARQHLHHFDVAKGYGALAEIFLRANYPQEALACFQTAYHLMPVGHGQQARQYNFMASALMRNGEYDRAEDLLHASRQISRQQLQKDEHDQDAHLSFLHSTMRFCWLHMLRSGEYKHALADEFAERMMKGNRIEKGLNAMPFGMMRVAYGTSCLMSGYQSLGQEQLNLAKDIFGQNMLMEYQWVLRIFSHHPNTESQICLKSLQPVFDLQVIDPPENPQVLDYTWQKPILNNQGFHALTASYQQHTDIVDLWRLFFI